MEAHSLSLKELFENNHEQFKVPIYQRRFAWGDVQLSSFWRALERQFASKNSTDHFMGAVVVAPSRQNVFSIVDGQQRLLTIQVLLAVMYQRSNSAPLRKRIRECMEIRTLGSPKKKVLPGPLDQEAFDEIWSLENETEEIGSGLLWSAYEFFDDQLDRLIGRKDENQVVRRLLKVLLDELRFVQITVDKRANAQEIFETLNHDGLPLNQADLIRNYLFRSISSEADEIYENVWSPMEAKLPRKSINSYLLSWTIYEARVSDLPLRPAKNNLFIVFKELLEDKTGDSVKMKREIKNIVKDAEPFIEIRNPESMTVKGTQAEQSVKSLLEDLNFWGSSSIEPILYEMNWRWRNRPEIKAADLANAMFRLESLLVRWMLAGLNQSPLTSMFRTMAQSSAFELEGRSLDRAVRNYLNDQRTTTPFPTNEEIKNRLSTVSFYKGNKQHRFVLQRLMQGEQQRGQNSFVQPIYYPAAKAISDSFTSIDHIMPKDLKFWKKDLREQRFSTSEASNSVNLIGNLCLVRPQVNPAMGNKPWKGPQGVDKPDHFKRDWYGTFETKMHQKIASNIKWGPAQISKRTEDLVKLASEIWKEPWV